MAALETCRRDISMDELLVHLPHFPEPQLWNSSEGVWWAFVRLTRYTTYVRWTVNCNFFATSTKRCWRGCVRFCTWRDSLTQELLSTIRIPFVLYLKRYSSYTFNRPWECSSNWTYIFLKSRVWAAVIELLKQGASGHFGCYQAFCGHFRCYEIFSFMIRLPWHA